MPKLSGRVAALRQERPLKLLTTIYCHDVQATWPVFPIFPLSYTKHRGGGREFRPRLDTWRKSILLRNWFLLLLLPWDPSPEDSLTSLRHGTSSGVEGTLPRQRDRGHKAPSATRRHEVSGDGGRGRPQAEAPRPGLQSRHRFQKHRCYLLQHT